jgi:3-deoxy-D-manno-octulosonic-acid transferase
LKSGYIFETISAWDIREKTRRSREFNVRTLYNILFLIFFALSSPYYFWRMRRRGDWQRGFGERFAIYDPSIKQAITNRQIVWIHAVSVGEVNLCTQLIHALRPRVPNIKFVVSCTTTTGMAELRHRLPSHVTKIYYPVDRRKFVERALATINPVAIILIEAEIWPNFLWRVSNLKIPLFLANARLSDRSFPRYKKFTFLFRPLFGAFTGVGCQSEEDAGRLREVGCQPEAVRVVGSLKFDAAKLYERRSLNVRGLLQQIGVPDDALILVAGSTHDGEEIILADMAARLREKFPKLFLILVPRHFERCKDLGQTLRARGVKFMFRNEIFSGTKVEPGKLDCLLVNTTGELKFFYEPASVVFIGKSLAAIGGQNPIEPAAQGKAIVFGPNMQNFTDITRAFLHKHAAVQVKSASELEVVLAEMLANPARRDALGRAAQELVAENLGAVGRTVEMILPHLKNQGILVVEKK